MFEIVSAPLGSHNPTLLATNYDEARSMTQLAFHVEREFEHRVRALGGDPHRPTAETDALVQCTYLERLTVVVWETEGGPARPGDIRSLTDLAGAKGTVFWIQPAR